MENRCLFYIPVLIGGKISTKQYKSPQSSPAALTARVRRTNSIASDVPIIIKPKHRSRNSVDFTENQRDYTARQDFGFKHTNELLNTVKRPPGGSISSLIKAKMIENKVLAESISTFTDKKVEDNGKFDEMKRLLKEEDLQIRALKQKVMKMTQVNDLSVHKSQFEEILGMAKQNEELRDQLKKMKNQRKKYGKPKVSKLKFQDAKSVLHKLELRHESNLTENSELQKSLIALKKSNNQHPSMLKSNHESDLKSALTDLLKLSYILNNYIQSQTVDFSSLITLTFPIPCSTVPEYLEKIRKTVETLRIQSTDLYAEHCGSTCNTQ